MTTTTVLTVRPVTPAVGAEINGVDLHEPLDSTRADTLRQALLDHGVLFFHDQDLTRGQFHAFLCNFGEPYVSSYGARNPSSKVADPAEFIIESDLGPSRLGTAVWHTDSPFVAEPPAMTALRAVKLPQLGGDTCWGSAYAAYETLSKPMRAMLDGLTAINSLQPALDVLGGVKLPDLEGGIDRYESIHPVVRVPPVTGRRALYVEAASTTRIVELTPAESAHILDLLFEHLKSPDFTMRHRWSVNDIAIWDNCAVMHYAVPDYDGPRIMQRVELAGGRPVGPA
jgi:alpha-ketoglutarate-dependent taurine dioxygenase